MMLLPSGCSKSDVHPVINNTKNLKFSTITTNSQLIKNYGNKPENGGYSILAETPTKIVSSTATTKVSLTPQQYTKSDLAQNLAVSAPSLNREPHDSLVPVNSVDINAGNVVSSSLPKSQSESETVEGYAKGSKAKFLENEKINLKKGALTIMTSEPPRDCTGIERYLEDLQSKLKDSWSVHLRKDGRLYYCNHKTKTSGWLPSCEDWSKYEELPYGWERAVDSKRRFYFINHLDKTTTFEAPESVKWDENPPEPRVVILQRSSTMGFGFVAGSERPVIVRFVTENGPSINKLQPGDQILAVNGEDVKDAPRDRVIQLVRACETQVTLLVCQPARNITPGRKSTLLSAGKRAKLKTRPSRVRFAESVCVNGAPLFPPSAFSLSDICVPPMANVLKVFLENGQTKSFKYDATTSVQDVVTSLLDKLCFTTGEIFSLVLEHVKSLKRNKLTLLDPEESLAKIASRPGAHKLRCLFRVTFVPISAADLAQKDLNALDYLYLQCCNDVTQERFSPELQPDVALRLAALHMHQHALANNVQASKLTVKTVEREFGLERFIPASLFEGMKRKELRRLIAHFLKMNSEMTGSSTKVLTQLQAKLHYLDIIATLPSYGAKCFSTNQREGVERVLLISPRFGLSQISSARNSVPEPLSSIEDVHHVNVRREDDITCSVTISVQEDRSLTFYMEDRDAREFSLCLVGYYRLLTDKNLPVTRERDPVDEENAPSYLAQHTVLPAFWSYLLPFHNSSHSINFLVNPSYHPCKINSQYNCEITCGQEQGEGSTEKTSNIPECSYSPSNVHLISTAMDLDIHSVMATEILEEAKDSGMNDSSVGGNNCGDRTKNNLNNSAKIEAKNEEIFRRVQEMQKMVENSEQYLNEQGEIIPDLILTNTCSSHSSAIVSWKSPTTALNSSYFNSSEVIEFDSDCDSLNSSKLSSNEETHQQNSLKHSDSLVILAETISHDLSGITESLNSIGSSANEIKRKKTTLPGTSSPRFERKVNGFSQLLSELQALGTDFSQSESDSESVVSPTNSPTAHRPSLLNTNDKSSRKQNLEYRTSFGLHSPDSSNFAMDTKDYSLKEYLKQLKEISNVDNFKQVTNVAAKQLSEIYGFEIREDTFIETDADLIDLRSIPPPQTPDELDTLSLLSAPPKGFDDLTKKTLEDVGQEHDLDKFLENVVVAPPTQKTTPAKELTPEEIMSFIIPPPPNLDEVDNITQNEDVQFSECLYSNSSTTNKQCKPSSTVKTNKEPKNFTGLTIEYATIERKSKFSCCPKSKREDANVVCEEILESIKPPPRLQSSNQPVPERPPKSAELIQRYSHKKQNLSSSTVYINNLQSKIPELNPPKLPPRTLYTTSPRTTSQEELQNIPYTVSPSAPKKPPLPLISARPILRKNPLPISYPEVINVSSPPPTQPRVFSSPNSSAVNGLITPPLQQHINQHFVSVNRQYRDRHHPLPTYPLVCSPHIQRLIHNSSPTYQSQMYPSSEQDLNITSNNLINKNGHIIDPENLLAKTDVAMAGLLVQLDQVAAQCAAAQSAGGGTSIDEDKFQKARNELTEQTLVLVTASKYLVVAMSDMTFSSLPEHLTSCLTAIRRITELTQNMTRHTSSPLQTRNIVLKVHDVASSFKELVGVQIGPLGAGQLALQAECLANVLATLLRSLRVFSP